MQVRGITDKHIIEVFPDETVTPAGLVLNPEGVQLEREKVLRGRVIGLGPGRQTRKGKFVPTELMLGDVVQFKRGRGWPIELETGDTREVIGLREDEVLLVEESS